MSKYPDEVVERVAKVMVEAFESELDLRFWSVEAHAVLDSIGVAEMVEALRLMRAEGPSRFSEDAWLAAERAIAKWEGRDDG